MENTDEIIDFFDDDDLLMINEPSSLLEGMRFVLKWAENSQLGRLYYEHVKTTMGYLCRQLDLNAMQVTLLTVILELGNQRRVSISEIANYLNVCNLDIMSKSSDLDTLTLRRFILKIKSNQEVYYTIPQEVYEAFQNNECYVHIVPSLNSDDELANQLDLLIPSLDESREECNLRLFDHDVQELLQANSKLHLARTLLGAMKKVGNPEFRVVLLMSMLWIRDEEIEVEKHKLKILFTRTYVVNHIASEINSGHSRLVKNKIVTVSSQSSLQTHNVFSLTQNFRKSLTPHRNCDTAVGNEQLDRRLTLHSDIKVKELFYNSDAIAEVERLQHLLQPDQTDGILQRLRDRNLRGGFTCLLYGGPGTGKTETVMQLARLSGRNIFQIDVASLRTKWYGESEKLVKSVFDDYRRMVRNTKVAPIMFFNEADAIFTRRMENAEQSVDKGENTLQNIILQEMETLDGILFATTNLQGNLDAAFERRFLYKLHLDTPSADVKARIWQSMLPDLSADDAKRLASEFDFSGGQIENVVRKRFIDEVLTGTTGDFASLHTLCLNEQLDNKHRQAIGFMK